MVEAVVEVRPAAHREVVPLEALAHQVVQVPQAAAAAAALLGKSGYLCLVSISCCFCSVARHVGRQH